MPGNIMENGRKRGREAARTVTKGKRQRKEKKRIGGF